MEDGEDAAWFDPNFPEGGGGEQTRPGFKSDLFVPGGQEGRHALGVGSLHANLRPQ